MSTPPFRRAIVNRNLNTVLNLALLVLVVASFVTGWVASWLELTEFAAHKYSSVALFALAAMHVALRWRVLMVQLRRVVLREAPPAPVLHRVPLGSRRESTG
jgi:hypothetical protein